MNQSEFSVFAEKYIRNNLPLFGKTIHYKEDDSFDCSIQSNRKLLSLWISTYDSEITIGFEDVNGRSDWHTHMSLFNAYEPEEELFTMKNLIEAILLDTEPIIFSSKHGYTLTNNVEEDLADKGLDEIKTVFLWSQL